MNRTARLKRYCSLMLCLLMLLSFFSVSVSAADTAPETVKVAWYEDSYHITGKNGDRSGYCYEFEQAFAAYTGWEYDYVKGDWTELLEKLENGEVDLMGALSYTEERAEKMLFSDQAMGREKYFLYADLENSGISASDLTTLNGKSIILVEKSVQATQFYEWEKKHNVQTKHVFADSIEKARELFRTHEAVGVVSSETSIWVDDGLSGIFVTGGSDIYYGINKNRPDLKEKLDAAMRAMESDKPFYADELYEQYLATQAVVALSGEEQEWLKQHGAVRVAYLNEDGGFSTFDSKSGRLIGVINDYVDYAKTCFEQPMNFELVGFDTVEDQEQALHDGRIDMIFHVSQNPYLAEVRGMTLSNAVLSIPVAVVTPQDAFNESAANRVAVAKDNIKFKGYLSYHYPKWDIVEYDSFQDAEKAVRSGQADCFIVRSSQSMKYSNNKELHCVFLTQKANSVFAVNRGNVVLMSILNKTLKSMQTSKLTGAISMYEDSLKKTTAADFIRDNLAAAITGFLSVFLVVLAAILGLLRKARKAEELARRAQAQAERANAAKSNFLFNMSHDIRTPMNALLGYNQLLKNELTDPKLLHYQKEMEQSGSLLLSIINNVLDMARIENGKMELDENCNVVEDTIDEIMAVFASTAQKKGVRLIDERHVVHSHVMCDVTKVKQVFVNLVSNAVKYTPAGGTVMFRVQELPCEEAGFAIIRTEVEDTGIGMSKEFLPKLYDAFSRERNTTTGKVAGTGLGMPIVKELVEKMGGTIQVESELGHGTKFTVTLRHRIADEKYYKKESGESRLELEAIFKDKHILLAEDNDLNAEIAITILEGMGLQIDRVEDGIQCVSAMEQKPAGTYDLILMDIQMPNMDGYKATEAIRRLGDKKKANIPIVAMTANAFEEDKKEALSRGMNAHLAKPLDIQKAVETIAQWLSRGESQT